MVALTISCPDCGCENLEKIYELRVTSEGGTHPTAPRGKLLALVCYDCSKRIELDDLVAEDEETGKVNIQKGVWTLE